MPCFESNAASLKLETGWLCLDFANTARWHASVRPKEELQSYRDLISWGRQIHLLTEPEAQRLLEEADRHPAEATAALERAILLREAVYRIFSAVTHGENPKTEDLALLNQELRESLAHAQIVPTDHRFRWSWMSTEDILD